MAEQHDNIELQVRRIRAKIKQFQLAHELGVDESTLSKFETRGKPLPRGLDRDDYLGALAALAEERKAASG